MIETNAIVDSLYFLLKKIGKTDKLKLVKLLYFADKYHLIKYGRTVTNDKYVAMFHGPVGSNTKDVLDFDDISLEEDEFEYASSLLKKVSDNSFNINSSASLESLEFLSETDIESLEFVVNNFGSMGTWEIRDFSHKYPEWKQYEELFTNKETKCEPINLEQVISVVKGDNFPFSDKDLEKAIKIILGEYD